MVESAVTFLLDGSISDSPLAKKIEFLEAKGLTDDEVKEAIRRAQISSADPNADIKSVGKPQGPIPPNPPPKDYQLSLIHI